MKRVKGLPKRVRDAFKATYGRPSPPYGVSNHTYDRTPVDWYETEGLVVVGHDTPTNAQLKVLDYCRSNLYPETMKKCGYTGEEVLTKASVRKILEKAVPLSQNASASYLRSPSDLDYLVPDYG